MPCLFRKKRHKKTVIDCIESVKKHSKDIEFIIIDDGSPLDPQFLEDAATTYIRHEKPMGIATSWNDGLSISRGRYKVVINDDIVAKEGWLECMVKALEDVTFALVSAPSVQHMANGVGVTESHENRVWFPGSCFMMTQKTLDEIGYFDEQFSLFNYEDVDYWTRVYKAGYVLARNYEVQIDHKEGQVIHNIEGSGAVNDRNREKYLKKWNFDPIPILYGTDKFPWEKI